MNKQVLKGFNYVATSASGTTITDSNGIVLCEVEAGKQGYFVATTDTIDVGTEDVSIVEIRGNFNVPSAGNGGGVDPTPYIQEIARLEALLGQLEAEKAELDETDEALADQIAGIQAEIVVIQGRLTELRALLAKGAFIGIDPAGTGNTTDIGALITQGGLFKNRTDITVWCGNLPNLVNQHGGSSSGGMFEGSSITSFYGNLPSLASGYYMFSSCSSLASFGAPSRSITINGTAQGMFYNCTSLTSFNIDSINGMTDGVSMFQNCSHLATFNATIPSTCGGARYMFYGTGLTEFGVDIPQQLTDARNMFAFSTNLTTFTGELHDGCGCQQMFEGCSSLTTLWPDRTEFWTLGGCSWMFTNCTSLTEWHLSLPSGLTNVQGLLKGCTSLRNWTAQSMGGVSSAAELFMGCKLNKTSVQRIVDTIPTYTSGSHPIAIGVDSTDITQEEQDAFNATLVSKGWTVTWGRN